MKYKCSNDGGNARDDQKDFDKMGGYNGMLMNCVVLLTPELKGNRLESPVFQAIELFLPLP